MASSGATRGARVSAAAYAVLALVVGFAIAAGTSLASTRIPPGVPGVPSQGDSHLDGPASLDQADQEALEDRVFKPTILQCHGWPDGTLTQTSDPRSPACVSGWSGREDNGGSTSPGVEDNLIRIGIPGQLTPELAMIADYINSRYEFYGRSLTFVPLGPVNSVPAQRAAAANAAAESVFAAIDYAPKDTMAVLDPDVWLTQLARQRIIGVSGAGVAQDRTLSTNGPYAWSIPPTGEQAQRYLGRLACTTLKDHPVRFSEQYDGDARRFAILTPGESFDALRTVDTGVLESTLRDCGADFQRFEFSNVSGDPAQTSRDQAMYQQMGKDGFTTVLVPAALDYVSAINAVDMQSAGYLPELVTVERSDSFWTSAPDLARNVIGVRPGPPPSYMFEPAIARAAAETGYTQQQIGDLIINGDDYAFTALGLIAAGVQAAGPDLTPETFAAGLESTRFPSPDNTRAWGFGGLGLQLGDHVLERDVGLGWYDDSGIPTAGQGLTVGKGRPCLIEDGRRFSLDDTLPRTDTAFGDRSSDCDAPGSAPATTGGNP